MPIKIITEQVNTSQRCELVDVTSRVERIVQDHNVRDGLAILYVPHTTAAITINENADEDVKHDLLTKLESLIPQREPYYRHAEGNSDSHVKTSLVGNSITVPIDDSELALGRWQGIYFAEFDGPRHRQLLIKIVDLG